MHGRVQPSGERIGEVYRALAAFSSGQRYQIAVRGEKRRVEGTLDGSTLVKVLRPDLAKIWHPDRFANDAGLRVKAEETLKLINTAYSSLEADMTHAAPTFFSRGPGKSDSARASTRVHRRRPAEEKNAPDAFARKFFVGLFGYLLLAPAALYVLLLVGAPFLFSLYLAVSDANVGDPVATFIGAENFRAAIEMEVFWTALQNSVIFLVVAAIFNRQLRL